MLLRRPSVLKDWMRCTTCGTTWDSEIKTENTLALKLLEGPAHINHTNLQHGEQRGGKYTEPKSVSITEHF